MIRHFSTLYVGHIELERCGLSGIPADDRRYPNARLVETFDTSIALARAAEALGYETLWLAEHHFQHEGYECIPNIPLLAVDLCHRTERIKIGCAFNVVPTWHPLRLAEDYATADILTGGRLVFGIGRGYHTREVETFGNPMLDAEANRELFEEQVEIILKAFREESFSHHGKHYTIPPEVPYRGYQLKELTLVPRPLHQPVEVWQPIVSGSARGLEFMARHHIKGVVSATADQFVDRWFRDYQAAARRHGRALALGEELILGSGCPSTRARSARCRSRGPTSRSTRSSWARSGCCATARST
jgi:alkanesulfonate monooxygenase SsuD/methylene tetrahydromethanopterin reductase-like flavin-dependent oxidoreductase (luciferase family)